MRQGTGSVTGRMVNSQCIQLSMESHHREEWKRVAGRHPLVETCNVTLSSGIAVNNLDTIVHGPFDAKSECQERNYSKLFKSAHGRDNKMPALFKLTTRPP